ncbi:MAG: phosphate ABC transporter permease subunit PstC [Actinobacteria bacterium]|nr:phosphate ABC transporter permease subunit PstC [Actinomycetota bacterium]
MTSDTTTPAVDLTGSRPRLRRERRVRRLFAGAAAVSIVVSLLIVGSLVGEAWTFLRGLDLSSLWTMGWFPRRGLFDVKTVLTGTLLIALVAMVVATPLGLGAAIYLSEYARPRARRWLKPILEVLAGIPSVVLGYFALTWISPNIVMRLSSHAGVFSMAAAGIAVGILVTPLVASVSEDAMRAVPAALREASYGLGAKKATTVTRIVFPAAASGIMASLILGVSRAIGETMVVAMAAGAVGGSLFQWNIFQPGQTMTAAMSALAIGSDQVAGSTSAFQSLFFLGLLLFLMTLGLNLLSDRFVRKVREKY